MSWNGAGGVVETFEPISELNATGASAGQVRAYANLVANFTLALYRVRYAFDLCVALAKGTVAPSVCEQFLPFICVYDVIRFQILAGRQGDDCGPNSRPGGLPTTQTCLDLFPLANRKLNPYANAVLDAYLAGTLSTNIVDADADYDATVAFVWNQSETAVVLAYPGVPALFAGQFCNRPGFLYPPGTVSDENWICFNEPGIFPFSSDGTIADRVTGAEYRRCGFKQQVRPGPAGD